MTTFFCKPPFPFLLVWLCLAWVLSPAFALAGDKFIPLTPLEKRFHAIVEKGGLMGVERQRRYPVTDNVLEARAPSPVKEDYKETMVVVHYPQNTGSKAVDSYLKRYAQAEFYTGIAAEGGNEGHSFDIKHYPIFTTYEVTKPSPRYISVAFTSRSYMGGAHDNWTTRVQSYDLKSGRLLGWRDLILPDAENPGKPVWDAARPRWENYIYEKLPHARSYMKTFGQEELPLGLDHIALTPQGLRVIFNPYDVSSFSEGTVTVDIPLKDLPKLNVNTALWEGAAKAGKTNVRMYRQHEKENP